MPTEYLNMLNIINSAPDGLTLFDILYQYQKHKHKPANTATTMSRKIFSMTQNKTIRFVEGKDKTYFLTEKGKQILTQTSIN